MRTLNAHEWGEVWIRLFQENPLLLSILLKQLQIRCPRTIKFYDSTNQIWRILSQKQLFPHTRKNRMETDTLSLFLCGKKWIVVDLLFSIERKKRFLWPRSYLLALDSLGTQGDIIIFTSSKPMATWCQGVAFQDRRFHFTPRIIDLSARAKVLLTAGEPLLALLGFHLKQKKQMNDSIACAIRVLRCAYSRSFIDAINLLDVVFWMSSEKLKNLLVKKLLTPHELLKTHENKYLSSEIQEFISFLEERGRKQAAIEIFQDLLQKRFVKFPLLSASHHLLMLKKIQNPEHLKSLLEKIETCENPQQILIWMEEIRERMTDKNVPLVKKKRD